MANVPGGYFGTRNPYCTRIEPLIVPLRARRVVMVWFFVTSPQYRLGFDFSENSKFSRPTSTPSKLHSSAPEIGAPPPWIERHVIGPPVVNRFISPLA